MRVPDACLRVSQSLPRGHTGAVLVMHCPGGALLHYFHLLALVLVTDLSLSH